MQIENKNIPQDIILEKSKSDPLNYSLKIFPNGLKALLISDPEANKSSAALGVNIGSLSDPEDAQGLAHFCEHLLFLGTEKYPIENDYKNYLSKNSGSSNAFTSSDKTVYYFEVSNEGFLGALDRFANFFICSKFDENSVEREINAIEGEFNKNLNNDVWRLSNLKKMESNPKSVFHKFSTGNLKTLNLPNIREKLLEMYNKYYSSEIMYLCIYNNKPLNEINDIVENLFNLIPKRKNFIMPIYNNIMPYNSENLNYFYKIVPIKDKDIIKFFWFLPYNNNYYAKPLNCLSALFGHEGPNSLTSSLLKDNFIKSLSSSEKNEAKTFSSFNISIELTKKGLKFYKEVILRVLKYIKIIQTQKLNERFFNEVKNIHQIKFDYKNKLTPVNYTKKYATDLMKYELKDILTASYVIKEIDLDLIKTYLDYLTMDNLNIYFLSQSIEKECELKEEIYGTKYHKEKLNSLFNEEEINSYKCDHELGYPPENKFYPNNFDILEGKEEKYPKKIMESENCNVYFLQDTTFKLPKAEIGIKFKLPMNLCDNSDLKNKIIASLLTKIINEELNEITYMAAEMNFNFSFNINYKNISIKITGFNASIKNGIKEIITLIKNINLKNIKDIDEKLNLKIKDLIKLYKNKYLEHPNTVNLLFLETLMSNNKISLEELLNFFNNDNKIVLQDLIDVYNNLFSNIRCDWLIQGNLSLEESLETVKMINDILNIDIHKKIKLNFYHDRIINIQKKCNFIYAFENPNKNQKNCSILSLYQCGCLTGIDKQYLFLVYQFLKEKFFTQLRTKETLGYSCSLSINNMKGIYGIIGKVMSPSSNSEFCSQRIKNFFAEKENIVKNITDEDFKFCVDSRIVEESKKDNNLSEQFRRNWNEILINRYEFDIKEKNIENLNKCNKEGFIKFYQKYFIDEASILDCQYICHSQFKENEKMIKNNIEDFNAKNDKKMILVNNIEEFRQCNELYPDVFSTTFREL